MRVKEAVANDLVAHDYLFTWKPGTRFPIEELRKLVYTFDTHGIAEESWTCKAHRRIRPGYGAYLLKQGKPIGIFGRGTVVGEPKRKLKVSAGEGPWEVRIEFAVSRGDVLWDPGDSWDQFLVNERQLLDLPAAVKLWQNPASGISLAHNVARQIDDLIDDSISLGRSRPTPVDEDAREIARVKRLMEQLTRPEQAAFSKTIRRNYRRRCAVTDCVTHEALQAAHIRVRKGVDYNSPANGILVRSDIHALFDMLLITLSKDGTRIELSPELSDQSYAFLRSAVVTRPDQDPPSAENIREHRHRFFERQKRRSGYPIAAGHL